MDGAGSKMPAPIIWSFMKKFFLLNIFLAVFAAGTLTATNYTVSSAGEVSAAMAIAQPGDTLFMTAGIWKDQLIRFSGNGTADNPIILKGAPDGSTFITGKSYLRIGGEYLVVDGLHFTAGYCPSGSVIEFRDGSSNEAEYCRLTNTAIINFNPASINTDYKWVSLYGKYNRVDHCTLKGKNHSGTTLVVWMDSEPDYHLIDSNYFGERPDLGFNGGETIRIGTSDWSMYESGCIVEYNLFERCDGETEIISNKSCFNVYRYNTFLECKGTLTLRHGNNCDVYSNFFLGNNRSSTGGIRVIGENHKVYNNYLENLDGEGYRAAVCLVRGVENSPLNRYFQVINAEIVNNTIVNCGEGFAIGYGSSSDQTLPPKDIKISNNVVLAQLPIIRNYIEPINLVYTKNIMYGASIGLDPVPVGIMNVDPLLSVSSEGLYRPANDSPVKDAADLQFTYVTDDFDGQPRITLDIGADEISTAAVIRTPVDSLATGVNWSIIPEAPPLIVYVNAGVDSLKNAINSAETGTVVELITSGGSYEITSEIFVTKDLTIRAAESLDVKPEIKNIAASGERSLFVIKQGGRLALEGLDLNGNSGSGSPAKYIIRTDESPFSYLYDLTINNCVLHDIDDGGEGYFFRAFPGTKADRITVKNSILFNAASAGFRLNEETPGSSKYNANYLIIENCTIYNLPNEAVSVYSGDNIPFTPATKVIVDHTTFYSCGINGTNVILPLECDSSIVKNTIFSDCSPGIESVKLYGLGSVIEYSTLYNSGWYTLSRSATAGVKVVDYNPMFSDAPGKDFTLSSESPVLLRAAGKKAMGDLRWGNTTPTKYPLDLFVEGDGEVSISPETEYFMYDQMASVTLTGTPGTGYELTGFSGDVNSTNNPLSILMFGATEITAEFDVINGVNETGTVPESFALYQNYPNPFNPSTKVKFDLPENSSVRITLYNILGEKLQVLLNDYLNAGSYETTLNAENMSSGIYLLEMQTEKYRFMIKINLLR